MAEQAIDAHFSACGVRVIHLDRVRRARARTLDDVTLDRLCALLKALGDRTRLGLVLALRDQEMCVCDLAAALGLSESAASHQLRRLRDVNLVRARREGQIVYYRLDDDHVVQLLDVGLAHAGESP